MADDSEWVFDTMMTGFHRPEEWPIELWCERHHTGKPRQPTDVEVEEMIKGTERHAEKMVRNIVSSVENPHRLTRLAELFNGYVETYDTVLAATKAEWVKIQEICQTRALTIEEMHHMESIENEERAARVCFYTYARVLSEEKIPESEHVRERRLQFDDVFKELSETATKVNELILKASEKAKIEARANAEKEAIDKLLRENPVLD